MIDLGKYAGTVLAAYGASLALIAGLVLATLWRGRKARRALEAQEARARQAKAGGDAPIKEHANG